MKRAVRWGGVALVPLIAFAARARPAPHEPCTSPHIIVDKSAARLQLVCAEGTRSYPVTFGASPVGNKRKRGDERTPEGTYRIAGKKKSARFDRFMLLSYPSPADRAAARKRGDDPGGEIGIHGVRSSLALVARLFIRSAGVLSSRAWGPTDGCIAMINEDVEALYDVVSEGTPVTILP